ncbi:MAG: RND family transporter, partial [bacterium]
MKMVTDKIIQFRWLIIIGFTGITAFFASRIPQAVIEPDMKSQLPKNMVSRINTEKIDELFGGTDMIMVLILTEDVLNSITLTRVKKLSRGMNRIKGVDKVLS